MWAVQTAPNAARSSIPRQVFPCRWPMEVSSPGSVGDERSAGHARIDAPLGGHVKSITVEQSLCAELAAPGSLGAAPNRRRLFDKPSVPWIVLIAVLAGCGAGTAPSVPVDAGPCGPCPSGQGCDVAKGICAPGGVEGAACGADAADGGPSICVDGLSCGSVAGGAMVCARSCAGASDCAAGQRCYLAQAAGQTRKYCASAVGLGEACGPSALRQCEGSGGVLVSCIEGADGGVCMQRCDAQSPCPSGQACSTSFSDGAGVCGPPTAPGSRCDQTALQYCSQGQVCVVEAGSQGTCHSACTAAAPCAPGDACIHADPCSDAGAAFCVTPQPIDGGCAPADDRFCGPGAVCVNLSGALLCKPDCSGGAACGAASCHDIPGTCQSACF